MISLEEIERKIKEGLTLEEALRETDWKDFESLVAEIFEIHGYKTKKNFRFKTFKWFEIDVIAEKSDFVFCVECKKWGKGRYKKSQIRKACKIHSLKTFEFSKFIDKRTIPLIVTYLEEDIIKENDVIVVPIWKLNSFLLNFFLT